MLENFEKLLQTRIAEVNRLNIDGKKSVFVISSTVKSESEDFFFTPIRVSNNFIITGIVLSDTRILTGAEKLINEFDYIFVDQEKKIYAENGDRVNVEADIINFGMPPSKIKFFKANDVSVDAVFDIVLDHFIDQNLYWGGRNVAIIGAGNIGSKIALRLVECGINCYLFRRNKKLLETVIAGINAMKPSATIAMAHPINNLEDMGHISPDIILGCSNTPCVFDLNALSSSVLCLDLGKGSFTDSVVNHAINKGIKISRVSVEGRLLETVQNNLSRHVPVPKRRVVRGQGFVSGGYFGTFGDIVVDDANDPKIFYGIANGSGDFLTRDVPSELRMLLK